MALITNNLEGGAEGTNITVGNSGGASGTAFTSTASTQMQYRETSAYGGLLGMQVTALSASAAYVDFDDAAAASSFALRFYLRMESYPSVTNIQFPLNIRTLSGTLIRTDIDNTGGIRIGNLAYSSSKLQLNTWYRIECQGTGFGAGAGAGTLALQVYAGDDTGTPYIDQSLTGQTFASAMQRVRYGKASASPTTADFAYSMDDFAQNVGSSTPLGPAIPSGITGNAGLDQTVEPWSTVTLAATGTGTWAQDSGPVVTLAGSGLTRTFEAPGVLVDTELQFSYGGDTVTITVMAATERLVINGAEVACVSFGVAS